MVSPNDYSNILDKEGNKGIAKKPIYFYDTGKHAFVTIEQEIIDKLRLTRRDLFTQEIVSEGILLRRFIADEN
jgi:hypothetical protein